MSVTHRSVMVTHACSTIGERLVRDLIADDTIYTGTEEVMSYRTNTRERFAWFPGRQIIPDSRPLDQGYFWYFARKGTFPPSWFRLCSWP